MRFAILLHKTDQSNSHYDLLFEDDMSLLSWKMEDCPFIEKKWLNIKKNFPHRKLYLDYEGEIYNNRGIVERIDFGTYDFINRKTLSLKGEKLSGSIRFEFDPDMEDNRIFFTADENG